jgi:hypothetical protein
MFDIGSTQVRIRCAFRIQRRGVRGRAQGLASAGTDLDPRLGRSFADNI